MCLVSHPVYFLHGCMFLYYYYIIHVSIVTLISHMIKPALQCAHELFPSHQPQVVLKYCTPFRRRHANIN